MSDRRPDREAAAAEQKQILMAEDAAILGQLIRLAVTEVVDVELQLPLPPLLQKLCPRDIQRDAVCVVKEQARHVSNLLSKLASM